MSSPRTTMQLSSRLILLLSTGVLCLTPATSAQEREQREGAWQERDRPAQENEEIRTVRRRLKVMGYAVHAFLEAERGDAADLVRMAVRTREFAIEGVRNEKAAEIAARAPNRGQLAELLGAASNLYEKWGQQERSHALAELAEVYGQQWRRQQSLRHGGAEGEGRTTEREREGGREQERRGGEGLDDLGRRLHIIEIARAAFDRAGRERNEKSMANAVRYGRLALGGSNEEALAKAAESVPSKGNLIELLHAAHNLLAEEGAMERAVGCHQLAEYYTRQVRAERGEGEGEREVERERDSDRDREREGGGERQRARGGIEDLGHRIEILRIAHGALAEAGKEDWAQKMQRFIHVAELQAEGANEDTLAQALEGLSMGTTIELLQMSSGLYAEWGMEERAAVCNQLAEFYAQRERGGREGGEEERGRANERERRAEAEQERAGRRGSLENREQRIEILRLVHAAWRESDNRQAAELMERILHLAELQLEGAGDDAIARAAEGLNQGTIIELVQGAHNLYKEWGNQERAAATRRLVEFYRNRAEGAEGNQEREQARERARGNEREQARQRREGNEREREQARERREGGEREQAAKNREAGVKELRQEVERLKQELRELKEILRKLSDR